MPVSHASINDVALKTFTLYRSSAGSGKTRTLAKEYVKLALNGRPDYFHHILAVTFTNKATQEMKERILKYLDDFANGRANNLAGEIMQELSLDEKALREKSHEVLSGILHHYSRFSISTIDAFFQKVIRSFTREAGLLGNFRLEVDNEYVLDEVISSLMSELGPGSPQLTEWVVRYSDSKLRKGDAWNVKRSLRSFGEEILKEQFKVIEDELLKFGPEESKKTLSLLVEEERRFHKVMKVKADEALRILADNNIGRDDFNYGDSGTALKYFQMFAENKDQPSDGKRIQEALIDSSSWPKKKNNFNFQKLKDLAESKLRPLLNEMVDFEMQNMSSYYSARAVLANYYGFGLISDITRKLDAYRTENNMMLLSDASKFLNKIIGDSDTPFIYEKVGTRFRHFLIDEFQDTSLLQWRNFIPLLKEASDQNQTNLIVGDVKQSVYRWRGGNLELLQYEVLKQFGKDQTEIKPLNTNYRSAGRIVDFNNLLFAKASGIVSETVQHPLAGEVYSDVEQQKSKLENQGFVRIQFLDPGKDDEWMEVVLRQLPAWLERLQDIGTRLKDIAILVRTNDEGQQVANYLLKFRQSAEAKAEYKYEVVSNESLRLDASYSVNVLITALKFLKNPNDAVARGQLAYEWTKGMPPEEIFRLANERKFDGIFPLEFYSKVRSLKKLSMYELSEELVRLFGLGKLSEELAYIQAFQDLILEFSSHEKTDLVSFLEWWEFYKEKKSMQVSSTVDAVNIFTIHKAKGLQFKYVIIPFCDWQLDGFQDGMLWVEAKEKPFDAIGPVAVNYNRALEKTLFANAYKEEVTKNHVDNLNVLYVAFTRAENGLVVFAPVPREPRPPKYVSELVYRSLEQQPQLAENFRNEVFEWGTLSPIADESRGSEYEMIRLDAYESADWRSKLVIKRQGSEFFEETISEKRGKINHGILLHTVLSRISHTADAAASLENYFLENALPQEERERVSKDVDAVLTHPQMGKWFSKEWDVKTEALVLLPGGKQKRFDRIMFGKKATVIVDYKTGPRKNEDRAQIEEYGRVLTQMGYPNVEAYLAYLSEMKVAEVIKGSNLSMPLS